MSKNLSTSQRPRPEGGQSPAPNPTPAVLRHREWVLRNVPEDPTLWLERVVAEELADGHHPGRRGGPLGKAANSCFVAATGGGGGQVRMHVTAGKTDPERQSQWTHEITRYRPRI